MRPAAIGLGVLALAAAALTGLTLSHASAAGAGGTSATVDGSTVTIAVNIDLCCATAAELAVYGPLIKEQVAEAEALWNAALAKLPVQCLDVRVAFTAHVLQKSAWESGFHRVSIAFGKDGRSMVHDPSTQNPNLDTPSAYDTDLEADFYYDAMTERAWAHEIGHLMGLGDDYQDPPRRPRDHGALPGREGTLMDTGTTVDQDLANRLLAIARAARAGVPACWTGTLHMNVRDVLPTATCVGTWDAALDFAVAKDGAVNGKARVTKAPPNSCGQFSFAIVGQQYPLTGTMGKRRLKLRLVTLPATLTRHGNSASGPMTAQIPGGDSTAYYDGDVSVSCGSC
jgi:hypothetical protein